MAANPGFQGYQGLSALEVVWPVNEAIPEAILQHLNLRDVWNLRKTNQNMNFHLQGHSRPNNPNTTLSFVGAHCDEIRLRRWLIGCVPCPNGPQADVMMNYCENAGEHSPNKGGPFNVCEQCINHNNLFRVPDEYLIIWSLRESVCKTCQDEEERAYPEGRDSCICRDEVRRGWKCDPCCAKVLNQIDRRGQRRFQRLNFLHRDRYGRVTFNPLRRKQRSGCRCGRSSHGAQAYQQAVVTCLGCNGVVVAPSNQGRVFRRSERIRRIRRAAEDARR